MKIIDLTPDMELRRPKRDVMYRMEFPASGITLAGDAQASGDGDGDVVFSTIAVDAKKNLNRKGFRFSWEKPEDVKVLNFMKNPVMLYAHDRDTLPIGRWEGLDISRNTVTLTGRIPGGPDYPELHSLRVRIRDGYLKAVSIGFLILRSEEIKDTTGGVVGLDIKEWELVECSVCPIGAHEGAIIKGKPEVQSSAGCAWEREATPELIRLSIAEPTPEEVDAAADAVEPIADEAPDAVVPDAYVPDAEEQEGRVLSKANRATVVRATAACEDASKALKALLAASEKAGAQDDEPDASSKHVDEPEAETDPPGTAQADPTVPLQASLAALVRGSVQAVLNSPEFAEARDAAIQQAVANTAAANLDRRKNNG